MFGFPLDPLPSEKKQLFLVIPEQTFNLWYLKVWITPIFNEHFKFIAYDFDWNHQEKLLKD